MQAFGAREGHRSHCTPREWMCSFGKTLRRGKRAKRRALPGGRAADGAREQQFSTVTAYCNHLESIQTLLMAGLTPRDADWIVLAHGQGVGRFKSYPGDLTQSIFENHFLRQTQNTQDFLLYNRLDPLKCKFQPIRFFSYNITICQGLVRQYNKNNSYHLLAIRVK